jgi:hypothetical protein
MRDPRFVIRVARFGVAMGLVFLQQPAEAGERKAEVRSERSATGPMLAKATAPHGDHAATGGRTVFVQTSVVVPQSRVYSPTTEPEPGSQPKRKPITFFRFRNSKLGEVSVQPVVGGVNGAQLSFGF